MRIAFITPEYITESPDHGGLAAYLHAITRALQDLGHQVEVFALSTGGSRTDLHDGIRVTYCASRAAAVFKWFALEIVGKMGIGSVVPLTCAQVLESAVLASQLRKRERTVRFHLVQCADFHAPALFVAKRADRPLAVRCSVATDLYQDADGISGLKAWIRFFLEQRAIRRADVVYAPSRFVADHYSRVLGRNVEVIRPPWPTIRRSEAEGPLNQISDQDKFLIHFGQLIPRKGTDTIAKALLIAWRTAPDLRMIWIGKVHDPALLDEWIQSMGQMSGNVTVLSSVPRPELFSLIARARAAVLPSVVDNLPNSVIESLAMGVPVIGTLDSSIDELVEEGVTGHLVPINDPGKLAARMLDIWMDRSPVRKGFTVRSEIRGEMDPPEAVRRLLAIAKRRKP